MTDEEIIAAENLVTEIRKETVADVLIDLRDILKTCPAGEREGLQSAIDMIESNY